MKNETVDAKRVEVKKLPGRGHLELVNGRPNWKDHEFHFSELDQYTTCPYQFKLDKLMGYASEKTGAALVRGKAVHRAISEVKNKGLWSSPVDVVRAMFKLEEEHIEGELDAEERAELPSMLAQAEEIMTEYATREYPNRSRIIYTEVPFTVDIAGNKFAGTVDEIRDGDKGLRLIDYKTNMAAPDPVFLRNNPQFMIYALAMRDGIFTPPGGTVKIGQEPEAAVWYQLMYLTRYKRKTKKSDGTEAQVGDLKGDPEIVVPWGSFCAKDAMRDIRLVVGAIKGNVFFKRAKSIGSCSGFCKFTRACCGDPTAPKKPDFNDVDFDDIVG